jgi:PAS domain-containing protein
MSFYNTLAEAVLSASSDAIIAADKQGVIRFWNPGAERIFGYAVTMPSVSRWISSCPSGCESAIGTATTRS